MMQIKKIDKNGKTINA